MNRSGADAGFGIIEVIVIIVVVAILVGIMARPAGFHQKAKSGRIKCVSNLKNVGLAFRIFATDNNDRFPGEIFAGNGVDLASIDILKIYGWVSNELSSPKILYCPEDKKRKPAEFFTSFTAKNISYFASLTASESSPQSFLAGDRNIQVNGTLATGLLSLTTNRQVSWSKDLHNEQGNIVMGDGSVQQMSTSRLKQAIRDEGMAMTTNYLVFP